MFIIKYTSGSWDDFSKETLFITEDEDFAKKYCEKANSLVQKVKEFVEYLDEKLDKRYDDDVDEESPEMKTAVTLWCKYHSLSDVNTVSYETIEKR